MGLGDEGQAYYEPGGRMEYAGTKKNGFNMKDISNGDIKQILNYAKDNMEKSNYGNANVEVSGNAKQDLKNSKNIEVSDK
jgi:hypothetical protein